MPPYDNEQFCNFAINSVCPHPENVGYNFTQKIVENSSQTVD